MRIAIVSDIHGNLSALEAVIADLRKAGPDLVVHGGDLVGSGSRPAEVIDRIRELKWPGVQGNTDEMLWMPERVAQALQAPQLRRLRDVFLEHVIPATCHALGDARLAWLKGLPTRWSDGRVTVVHAAPDNLWRAPLPDAPDEELERTYGPIGTRHVVYGHIHRSFVRRLPARTVTNSGSVSLSYDGDPRPAYAVIDDDESAIRRVEYDIDEEVGRLAEMKYPYAGWLAGMLRTGTYVHPPAEDESC